MKPSGRLAFIALLFMACAGSTSGLPATTSESPAMCGGGYEHSAGGDCVDVDECTGMPCDSNASCSNSPGGYSCSCNIGYTGTGTFCSANE